MYKAKKYSQTFLSLLIIVLAGYAGVYAGTLEGPTACNARMPNGHLVGSTDFGCCFSNDYNATVVDCDGEAQGCKITFNESGVDLECTY